MIKARIILDSIGPTSDYSRLHTQLWRYPKFVHQESLRHRKLMFTDWQEQDFSFSVSSARAIPFKNLIAEVRNTELRAKPVIWGSEQKGMSPGSELRGTAATVAETLWNQSALKAADFAEDMATLGVHKSIVNRIIEPYIHVNCLVTGTTFGWVNFFGLRLDGAVDPTLRALAESSWRVWNESKPQVLQPDKWHLPFIDAASQSLVWRYANDHDICDIEVQDLMIKISVARCARLSYMSFATGKRSTIEEDLDLYQRLVGSIPIHASPAEHQATPDTKVIWSGASTQDHATGTDWFWRNPEEAGNLGPGWRQFRKMLPNEAVAPLPERYKDASP